MTDTEGLALQNMIDNLEVENQFLRRKIDYLTRRFFGGKKSEQIDLISTAIAEFVRANWTPDRQAMSFPSTTSIAI